VHKLYRNSGMNCLQNSPKPTQTHVILGRVSVLIETYKLPHLKCGYDIVPCRTSPEPLHTARDHIPPRACASLQHASNFVRGYNVLQPDTIMYTKYKPWCMVGMAPRATLTLWSIVGARFSCRVASDWCTLPLMHLPVVSIDSALNACLCFAKQ
jgi:hypothetical protein